MSLSFLELTAHALKYQLWIFFFKNRKICMQRALLFPSFH